MKTQREKFEAWASKNGYDMSRVRREYDKPATRYAWQAWQAAIESVVVELPVLHDAVDAGFAIYAEDIVEALDKAGIKYE